MCVERDSPGGAETRDYLIEFRGEHLGVEFLQSRTVVSILDGTATLTSRRSRQSPDGEGGNSAGGRCTGNGSFRTIDLAQENSAWEQAGLGRVAVTQTTDSSQLRNPRGQQLRSRLDSTPINVRRKVHPYRRTRKPEVGSKSICPMILELRSSHLIRSEDIHCVE